MNQRILSNRVLSKLCLLALTFSSVITSGSSQFEGQMLKFKLAATNLPNADLDGASDPYVLIFTAIRRPTDVHRHWQYFGSTSTKVNTNNPEWDEVFQYQYINGTQQTWRFFVRDQDDSWFNPIYAIDDPLGHVDVPVEQYMRELKKAKQEEQERGNGTVPGPIKAIQTFLAHPIGGAILIKPIEEYNINAKCKS